MSRSIETRTIGHTAVHTVTAADDADPYAVADDADSIGDGDVIVIGTTVGVRIVSGHTCAVTERIGGFAVLDTDYEPWAKVAAGRYAGAYNVAVNVATQLGAPLMRPRRAPAPTKRATGKPAASKATGKATTRTATPARSAARSAAASHHLAAVSSAALDTAATSKTPARASSSATTGRARAPRRTVPGVQFSDDQRGR
jgi:hypothetical protein